MKKTLFLLLFLPAIVWAQCIPTDSIRYDIDGDVDTVTATSLEQVPCMATCQPQGHGSLLSVPAMAGMIQVYGRSQQVHLQITDSCRLVVLDTCLQLTGRFGPPFEFTATWPSTAMVRIYHSDTLWTWFQPLASAPTLAPAIYDTDTLCSTSVQPPQGMPEGEPQWYDLQGHHHAIPPRGVLVIDRICRRRIINL